MIGVVIGRAAPLRVGSNAIIILLLLKDPCCIRSLASQATLTDRLAGTGADKHGITRTFTRTGLTAAGAVAVAVAEQYNVGRG